MKQDLTNLNKADQTELAFLHVLITMTTEKADDKSNALILEDILRKQPALQNLARFLYLSGKYNERQGEALKNLCILVWLYYKDRLKSPPIRIEDALFLEKKAAYQNVLDKVNALPQEQGTAMLMDYLKNNPGRFIYGYIQGMIYEDQSSPFMTLSKEAKSALQDNFKVMTDCFESIIDRSIVPAYLDHGMQ